VSYKTSLSQEQNNFAFVLGDHCDSHHQRKNSSTNTHSLLHSSQSNSNNTNNNNFGSSSHNSGVINPFQPFGTKHIQHSSQTVLNNNPNYNKNNAKSKNSQSSQINSQNSQINSQSNNYPHNSFTFSSISTFSQTPHTTIATTGGLSRINSIKNSFHQNNQNDYHQTYLNKFNSNIPQNSIILTTPHTNTTGKITSSAQSLPLSPTKTFGTNPQTIHNKDLIQNNYRNNNQPKNPTNKSIYQPLININQNNTHLVDNVPQLYSPNTNIIEMDAINNIRSKTNVNLGSNYPHNINISHQINANNNFQNSPPPNNNDNNTPQVLPLPNSHSFGLSVLTESLMIPLQTTGFVTPFRSQIDEMSQMVNFENIEQNTNNNNNK
jgi:hypothetical protein